MQTCRAPGPRRRVPVSADAPEGPTNVHEGGFGGADPLDVRLGLLDFGSVGVIDAETRQLLATLLLVLRLVVRLFTRSR